VATGNTTATPSPSVEGDADQSKISFASIDYLFFIKKNLFFSSLYVEK
jgi:hypothetical protein